MKNGEKMIFLTNTNFKRNTMSNDQFGYVLLNNGIIGTQGSLSQATDNKWTGTWTLPNYKTATLLGSSSQFSPLYIRTTGVSQYNPDPSTFTSTSPGLTDYLFSNGSLVLTTSNPPVLGCITFQHINSPANQAIALLEQIALDVITFPQNDSETKYINKNQLYRLLRTDPTLMDSSTVLMSFFNANANSVYESITVIEDDIAMGDISDAQVKTNLIQPSNPIEDNYKTFFNEYIKHQTDTILPSDSLIIIEMAGGCPFTDGDVVYQARALYNSIFGTNIFFEDDCPLDPTSRFQSNGVVPESAFDVLLYPNPNMGSFAIVPFSADVTQLSIKVVDFTGKTVYTGKSNSTERLFNLTLDLPNGVYSVIISDAHTNESIIKRTIIQK